MQSIPMEVDADTEGIGHVARSTPLFKCLACHTTFLTKTGLITHHQKHPKHAQMDRPVDQSASVHQGSDPRPAKVTMKLMLASHPDGPCPEPARMYRCPLCQDYVGRKALINHLRKYHDVHRHDGFPFDPVHDMHRGHLACKHCHTQFTVEVALRTHFQRASCPVRLCNWTSHQHFGASIMPLENMDPEDSTLDTDQVRVRGANLQRSPLANAISQRLRRSQPASSRLNWVDQAALAASTVHCWPKPGAAS